MRRAPGRSPLWYFGCESWRMPQISGGDWNFAKALSGNIVTSSVYTPLWRLFVLLAGLHELSGSYWCLTASLLMPYYCCLFSKIPHKLIFYGDIVVYFFYTILLSCVYLRHEGLMTSPGLMFGWLYYNDKRSSKSATSFSHSHSLTNWYTGYMLDDQ